MPKVIPAHDMTAEDLEQIPRGDDRHPSDTIPWDTRLVEWQKTEALHRYWRGRHEDPNVFAGRPHPNRGTS